MKLGLSGLLARTFINSPLTPLMLVAIIMLGALAVIMLPREEDPQISVPVIDIMVQADGLKAVDAAELVTQPLEDIVKAIQGVEHVYSRTEDDRVIVTARFFVNTDADTAILRVRAKIGANLDRIPIGIPPPLIVARGINDVPILVLTLAPKPGIAGRWTDNALYNVAKKLQHELVKVDNVGLNFVTGGRPNQIRIEPNPELLSLYGVTLNRLVEKLRAANRSFVVGAVRRNGRNVPTVAGQTLRGIPDIGLLLVTTKDGRPVYIKDVAKVVVGAKPLESRAWHLSRNAAGALTARPAVSLAFAKRKGANAVAVTDALLARVAAVRGRLLPKDLDVVVTRNYGDTANEKANSLFFHLALATVSIVILVAWALGWRAGIVVLVVIPATILITLFASWLMGFTINRVSLFALIFSIGILVDDAIVVVENIVRHWQRGSRDVRQAAIDAVAEVGNPTLIATLTVIIALLPMMFVSGMMGPYMSPIPANASVAMLFSYAIAVTVAPWLLRRVYGLRRGGSGGDKASTALKDAHDGGRLGRFYRRVATPILKSRRRAVLFLLAVGLATLVSMSLFYTRTVTVKLLPFDNKSEVQVILNMPEGSSLEATERVLMAAARRLADLPEMTSIQAYAGTASPFNFNGLVRHYYLRSRPYQGDLQINLLPKGDRSRVSHEIALDIRSRLARLATPKGAVIKVVEVPPGPPVLATLLAEIYGPNAKARRQAARQIRKAFQSVDFVVDTDDTIPVPGKRLRLSIDQENLEFYGVDEKDLYDTIAALLGGVRIGYSHRGSGATPIEITVRLPKSGLFPGARLMSTPVPARNGPVQLADVVKVSYERASYALFRHDGRYAEMVTANVAGRYEAPIYGMLAVEAALDKMTWSKGAKPVIRYNGQPKDESVISLLWDGEWEVTYVTFRDMGGAFILAIIGIYILVVGQFRSFRIPLLVLAPVPLTLIGIVFGHWLLNAPFTATSMIGFIALAGIIVRNSILLVDFIRVRQAEGAPLRDCLLEAGAVRFRPILLTALAAMIGAAVIMLDPVFQGLAISLLFGLASSTALTLLVIPAIYVWLRDDGRAASSVETRPD